MPSLFLKPANLLFALFSFLVFTNTFAYQWQPLNQGLKGGGQVNLVTFHPVNQNEMYLGTLFSGIYKTADQGSLWKHFAAPVFAGKNIVGIIFNPKNTKEIYVATGLHGIYKTEDAGRSWKIMNTGLKETEITSLVMNPQNPNELYLTTYYGAYKTINGGKNWHLIINGIKDHKSYGNNYDYIVINPNQPNTLFLETTSLFSYYLYKSIDGGQTWQESAYGADTYHRQISFTNNPDIIYTAQDYHLRKSENGGQTWGYLFTGKDFNHYVNNFAINKDNPQEIYIHVQKEGLYKTMDGGKTWQFLNKIYTDEREITLTFNPNNSNELYLTTEKEGIFVSHNGGVNWEAINNGIQNFAVISLAASEKSDIVYAGLKDQGLWLLKNKKWVAGDSQFAADTISKIVIDPMNPANILMIVQKDPSSNLIYRSTDYGQHWQQSKINGNAAKFSPLTLAFNPTNPKEVYAGNQGGRDVKNIWKSSDGGASWIEFSAIGWEIYAYNPVIEILINPKNPKQVLAGVVTDDSDFNPFYVSYDAGLTWENINLPNQSEQVLVIAADNTNPTIQYVAVSKNKNTPQNIFLLKTTDGGKTWQRVGKGLEEVPNIKSIIIDPTNSQTMYIATGYSGIFSSRGDGVYVSYDGGENWGVYNSRLINPLTVALTFKNGYLYTGTLGSGIFSIQTR